MRDFFGLPSKDVFSESEHVTLGASGAVLAEALDLAKGQPPEANLMPYISLIQAAQRLGLKVIRPTSESGTPKK